MKVEIDRMGVYILSAHLVITLTIILVYAYTLFSGQTDETLKTILTVIVGYWFGSMGLQSNKQPLTKPIEVNVTEIKEKEKEGV